MHGKRQELRRGVHYLSGIVCFAAGAAASAFMPSIAFFYIIAVFYFFTAVFYFAFIRARV